MPLATLPAVLWRLDEAAGARGPRPPSSPPEQADLVAPARPLEKSPADWGPNGEYGHYGMSNHTWLLRGPIALDDSASVNPTARPLPLRDGWSAPVFFHDDRIDLDRLFHDPVHCITWAYAEFDAPRTAAAQLWLGSDQAWRSGSTARRSTPSPAAAATGCPTTLCPCY